MKAKTIWRAVIGMLLLFMTCPLVKSFYFGSGLRWQFILFFSVLAAYLFTPLCRSLALRLEILDRPDWRKIHDSPTPLMGGMAVYLAFSFSLLLNGVFLPGMKALLFGSVFIFAMGLLDDVRPLPPTWKFILQILITLLVIIAGDISITFFSNSSWAPVLNIPLTVVWMVGLTNAMNFFDGVDGLAAGLSIIAATFLGIIAFKTNQAALGWLAVALAGACLGFVPHNFRPGKPALIFLGDAGSTFLGFTLAGLAVLGEWSHTSHFVSLTAPILIFGILIFDMAYVNASRIKNRQAKSFLELLTCVNKDHLHHRLLLMGFDQKEVVFIILTISTCLGVSALIIMDQRFIDALLGLFQAVLVLAIVAALMLKGRDRTPQEGDRRALRRRREDRIRF
ncbi:MAG: MraY family glycosyltransferase [Thermodesulfobacteriota bacterium]|nr:MraY family glycosyltransferase [Thermodesulfobacteriota bacterium]